MKAVTLYVALLLWGDVFSQGLINSSAQIVTTAGSFVVIDGATGHYTATGTGVIRSATAGGEIYLNGNWINNSTGVAFANDGVRTRFRGANQTIGGTNSSTFYHVNLEGTGTKQLLVNTLVGGITNLTGVLSIGDRILDLNSNRLTVTNGATSAITAGTGYAISETNTAVNPSIIQWNTVASAGSYVYPFGVAGTQLFLTFDKTTSTASNVSVATRATGSNNQPWAGPSNVGAVTNMNSVALGLSDASIPAVIDRWWDITPSAPVTANVTFRYRLSENTTNYAPADFGAQHWNGSSWDQPVGAGATAGGIGFVTANSLSDFSPYVLTPVLFPLPTSIDYLRGHCEGAYNRIEWRAARSGSTDVYIIEKSKDGVEWVELDQLTAIGNVDQMIAYTYDDLTERAGDSYYRLLEYTYDGTVSQLGIVAVTCTNLTNSLMAFPNPSNGSFVAEINSSDDLGERQLFLTDLNGKVLETRSVQVTSGTSQVHFSTNFNTGMYLLYLEGQEKDFEVQKIIIK